VVPRSPRTAHGTRLNECDGSGHRSVPGPRAASTSAAHPAFASGATASTRRAVGWCPGFSALPAAAPFRARRSRRPTTSSAPSCSPTSPPRCTPAPPCARSPARWRAPTRPRRAWRPGSGGMPSCCRPAPSPGFKGASTSRSSWTISRPSNSPRTCLSASPHRWGLAPGSPTVSTPPHPPAPAAGRPCSNGGSGPDRAGRHAAAMAGRPSGSWRRSSPSSRWETGSTWSVTAIRPTTGSPLGTRASGCSAFRTRAASRGALRARPPRAPATRPCSPTGGRCDSLRQEPTRSPRRRPFLLPRGVSLPASHGARRRAPALRLLQGSGG